MINRISDVIHLVPEYTEKVYASGPSKDILDCADAFFQTIPPYYRKLLTVDNVTINEGGTINIDWMVGFGRNRCFVSIEIGNGRVGFFSEMPDGINPEGVYPIGNECPKPIIKALQTIYCRESD